MSETSAGVFTVVISDPSDPASLLAEQTIIANADSDYNRLCDLFGAALPGGPPAGLRFTVTLTPGGPGASHPSCDGTAILVNPRIGGDMGIPEFTSYLVMSEVVEVLEARLNNGWDCQKGHGEALSRVLAQENFPGLIERTGRTTAKFWLNSDGRLNFVDPGTLGPEDAARNTDRDIEAVGCGILFLYWLHYAHPSQFGWSDIVKAGAPTLGEVYANLTGRTDGFTEFRNAISIATANPNNTDNIFAPSV
jgi:hypothetical protein